MRWLPFYLSMGFLAGYYGLSMSGAVSALPPASHYVVISSQVFLVTALVAAISGAFAFWHMGRGMRRWLGIGGLTLAVIGVWASANFAFYGEAVVTEGQYIVSTASPYDPLTQYKGKFARVPVFCIDLTTLTPEFTPDGMGIKGLAGQFQLGYKSTDDMKPVTIKDSGFPKLLDPFTWLTIKDFGYSPRYVLKSQAGQELESSFVFMRLFPPGTEDYFRLITPITYYVQHYPKGTDKMKAQHFHVRIARNKDIIFNDRIVPGQDMSHDNAYISFDEVRQWTKLVVRRDPGALSTIAGLLMIVIAAIGGRHKA